MPWWWQRRRAAATATEPAAGARRRFFTLGGRRYVADVPYMLPKDIGEVNRLDFQHYMLRFYLHGNVAAPVRAPQDVLDVGTGTGRWAVEVAQQFPQANVIGLDIEPPGEQSPLVQQRPENCVFVQGDVLAGLPFPDGAFGYVHQRLLLGAIPAARWPGVVRELARVTAPGGMVEMVEAAPVPGGGPALAELHSWMARVTAMRGVDVRIAPRIGEFLREAGLTGVVFRELPIPIGAAGGRLGAMAEQNYRALFMSLRELIIARGGVPAGTFDATLAAAFQEITVARTTSPYFLAYGYKPR